MGIIAMTDPLYPEWHGNLSKQRVMELYALEMAKKDREIAAWKESAAQFSRNADFYHGLISGIGAQFGEAAYISDDGSKQQDVLCLKVPELVAGALAKIEVLEDMLDIASNFCDIRNCMTCDAPYAKGWTRPCGHDDGSEAKASDEKLKWCNPGEVGP